MRSMLLALAALVAISFAPQAAQAQAQPAPAAASLRVIHAAAGGPGVDIYLDGQQVESSRDFFTEVSMGLSRGEHELLVVREGDPQGEALVGKRFYADSGDAYTLSLIGAGENPRGLLLKDRSDSPQASESRVRIIHAAEGIGPVNLAVAGGAPFLSGAVFGSATYVDVPPGTYALDLSAADSGAALLRTVELSLVPGWTYTLVVTGNSPENLWVQALSDRPAR